MENGRAGKVKKKKKEAEDMEQELLQEIASYWGTRAEGYSEVNEKELAGSQREAWLHVLEEQFPEKKKEEIKDIEDAKRQLNQLMESMKKRNDKAREDIFKELDSIITRIKNDNK